MNRDWFFDFPRMRSSPPRLCQSPRPYRRSRGVSRTALQALALSLLLGAVPAADWPQWRGPARDGAWREDGILKSFPADGVKVRWRAAVGPGWATPVIAAGRVFVTDVEMKKPQAWERVRCFDEMSGKELWSYAYEVTYPEWAF